MEKREQDSKTVLEAKKNQGSLWKPILFGKPHDFLPSKKGKAKSFFLKNVRKEIWESRKIGRCTKKPKRIHFSSFHFLFPSFLDGKNLLGTVTIKNKK
jgi:hypothetical protein